MPSIFITGAAKGIGKAVAEKFLHEGWTVGAYDLAEIPYSHPRLISGFLDVTDPNSWEQALAHFASQTNGNIDVVDNNAGILIPGDIHTLYPHDIARQITVNCTGISLGAHAAHKYLAPGATLVTMGSASAIYGQPGIAVYSATKFFVTGFTEALNLEWRKKKIRVISLQPLWVKTSLAEVDTASVRRLGVRISPETIADTLYRAVHPRNRWQAGKIHYGVSITDKLFFCARRIAPIRLARLVTRIVSSEW
ncbi:MAG: SDR family oxidoreductase [Corynebacterium sp.]|uniref:SDR family oxidoreductase n=1 Tax=Corynebacterium sp. TaxID=1720 RepID=UPI0026DBED60|nr:SDR family oxidoreductase [Corynebacterium sp.]MDO4761086.1 SDR family oxidoreductase [Corynebacterium sp.]